MRCRQTALEDTRVMESCRLASKNRFSSKCVMDSRIYHFPPVGPGSSDPRASPSPIVSPTSSVPAPCHGNAIGLLAVSLKGAMNFLVVKFSLAGVGA